MTIKEFILANGLSMTFSHTSTAPGGTRHFDCTLTSNVTGKSETVKYRMGSGLKNDPELEDVLDSLRLDASSFENADSAADFKAEFGYATIGQALQVWKACEANAKKLKTLVGETKYAELLYEVDAL